MNEKFVQNLINRHSSNMNSSRMRQITYIACDVCVCIRLDILLYFNSLPELFIMLCYDDKIKFFIYFFFFHFLDIYIDFPFITPMQLKIFQKKTSHGKYPETFSVFSSYISLYEEKWEVWEFVRRIKKKKEKKEMKLKNIVCQKILLVQTDVTWCGKISQHSSQNWKKK